MERILEPQLMTSPVQAEAYAAADFDSANSLFLNLFKHKFQKYNSGTIIDLGCGPGDIMFRFAKKYPKMILHGVDGSEQMMLPGRKRLEDEPKYHGRISFFRGIVPTLEMPQKKYDAIISNSLLHHMQEPGLLWQTIKEFSQPGTRVMIMDLFRPANKEKAHSLVEQYSAEEPEILKQDFFNSLCAAFEVHEVEQQLDKADLDELCIEKASDRHIIIWGLIK